MALEYNGPGRSSRPGCPSDRRLRLRRDFSGRLIDRIAPRWLITAGAALAAAGLGLTVFVREPGNSIDLWPLRGLGSACFGVVVCNSSVAKWIDRKRGLAVGCPPWAWGVDDDPLPPGRDPGKALRLAGRFIAMGLAYLIVPVGLPSGSWAGPSRRTTASGRRGGGPRFVSALSARWPLPASPLGRSEGQPVLDHGACTVSPSLRRWRPSSTSALSTDRRSTGWPPLPPWAWSASPASWAVLFRLVRRSLKDAKIASSLGFLCMALGMVLLLMASSATVLFLYALIFGFGYDPCPP